MAVVRMKKIMIAAPQYQRDSIIDNLQLNGSVQIESIKDEDLSIEGVEGYKASNSYAQAESDYNNIKFTYEFLSRFVKKKKNLFEKKEVVSLDDFKDVECNFCWQDVYEKCRSLESSINLNLSKKAKDLSQIEQYNEWLNLDICSDDLEGLKSTSYFIGCVSDKVKDELLKELENTVKDSYVELISQKKQDINIFVLCHKEHSVQTSEVLKKYGFSKTNIDLALRPEAKITQLQNEVNELDSGYEKLASEALKLSSDLKEIEEAYDYISCKLDKESSMLNLAKTKKTFVLEGWVPDDDAESLKKMLEDKYDDAYISLEKPTEDEIPPIKLKNSKFIEPFEMITSLYALPKYDEVDPTTILTPFYLLFFGMMAGDIGYGLVMLVGSAIALKFMDLEGDSRKLMKVLFYCSFPTMLFGWLFGGFFGDAIKIKPGWVNPVDNTMLVLVVCLGIGIIHLFTGLGVKAYWLIKNHKAWDAVFDVFFWYIFLSGLIWLLISSVASLPGATAAKYGAIAGGIGLLLTQGRSYSSIIGKFFGGVYGLYGVTSYIGDILSYSRLLALGLATGLIASSLNLLIKLLGGGVVAAIAGPVIFLVGHTFNFLIGMLGTFVHTCRLEYLEFFGKFYEGGGIAFQPLKIKTKFINVKTEN